MTNSQVTAHESWLVRCSPCAPRFSWSNLHVTHMSSVCHSYVLVCHLYVTRMYSYVIRMSLVCHPYVTRMYSYVIRMSLVCTRMSSVCHSYVLVCHSYVTRMYSYVIRMSHVCTRMSFVSHSSVVLPWTLEHVMKFERFLCQFLVRLNGRLLQNISKWLFPHLVAASLFRFVRWDL